MLSSQQSLWLNQSLRPLIAGGKTRDQAMLLLADLWHKRNNNVAPRQQIGPQPPKLQQRQRQPVTPGDGEQQPGQDQNHGLAPYPLPLGAPLASQELPPPKAEDQDGYAPDKADKRTPQPPPIDLEAESRTTSRQRPATYTIDRVRKFEYVAPWCFTEQGCQAAGKDKALNEDLRDVTKTRHTCLSLRTAPSNRPSPNAFSDEQLTWEQFQGYAKVLSSFFWKIEDHEDKGIAEGKETLLLYQARSCKAWHNKLKAEHFFNLAKLDDKKMSVYRKEVDAKHNTIIRKVLSSTFDLVTLDLATPYIPFTEHPCT
ncbi:hypothetical protein BGY98DRAFT_1190762 [Russula aff. rugulosa BPL654]|nr:hypothetical protein BGY98DRAFT_1190762 [Russula aff. rugulosa BPL654]